MTDDGTSTSDETGTEETTEAPGYTSPTEQMLQNLPFGIFRTIAERMSSSGSGGGGGSFEFSVAEMRELHRQFSDEADALKSMREKASYASHELNALADDPASRSHYTAAKQHFGKLQDSVDQQLIFAEGFRDAVGAAIGLKEGDDDEVASGFKRRKESM